MTRERARSCEDRGQAASHCNTEDARDIKFKFTFYEVIIARIESHTYKRSLFLLASGCFVKHKGSRQRLMIYLDIKQTEIGRHR